MSEKVERIEFGPAHSLGGRLGEMLDAERGSMAALSDIVHRTGAGVLIPSDKLKEMQDEIARLRDVISRAFELIYESADSDPLTLPGRLALRLDDLEMADIDD